MTNAVRNQLGIWSALALLVVAAVLPRFQERRADLEASTAMEQSTEAALEYARTRLWDDFLVTRGEVLTQMPCPAPSLPEYAGFLGRLGLSVPGDVATLYAVPRDARPLGFDQLRVALESLGDHAEIQLHVALDEDGKLTPVGMLCIAAGPDGTLACAIQAAEPRQLWSFWPIMPQPLLP